MATRTRAGSRRRRRRIRWSAIGALAAGYLGLRFGAVGESLPLSLPDAPNRPGYPTSTIGAAGSSTAPPGDTSPPDRGADADHPTDRPADRTDDRPGDDAPAPSDGGRTRWHDWLDDAFDLLWRGSRLAAPPGVDEMITIAEGAPEAYVAAKNVGDLRRLQRETVQYAADPHRAAPASLDPAADRSASESKAPNGDEQAEAGAGDEQAPTEDRRSEEAQEVLDNIEARRQMEEARRERERDQWGF